MLRIRFIALFFALMFCAGFIAAQDVTTEAVVMHDDDNAAYSITVSYGRYKPCQNTTYYGCDSL